MRSGSRTAMFGTHVPEFGYYFGGRAPTPVEGIRLRLSAARRAARCRPRWRWSTRIKLGVEVLFDHEVHCVHRLRGRGTASSASYRTGRRGRPLHADVADRAPTARAVHGAHARRTSSSKGHTWPERFVATNVKFPISADLGYCQANFVCDPVNMAVIAQLDRDGLWRCTYMEDARLPARHLRGAHSPALRMVHAGPQRLRDSSPRAPTCCTSARRRRLHKGRVLLAGDAAHATNPCGGLGLTCGCVDRRWCWPTCSARCCSGEEDEEHPRPLLRRAAAGVLGRGQPGGDREQAHAAGKGPGPAPEGPRRTSRRSSENPEIRRAADAVRLQGDRRRACGHGSPLGRRRPDRPRVAIDIAGPARARSTDGARRTGRPTLHAAGSGHAARAGGAGILLDRRRD